METLLRQLAPISAVIAAALVNIVNFYVVRFVPDALGADFKTLLDVGIMAGVIYGSNFATRNVIGAPIEKALNGDLNGRD